MLRVHAPALLFPSVLPSSLSLDLKPNKEDLAVWAAVVMFWCAFALALAAFLMERLGKSTGAGLKASMGMDWKRGEAGGEMASYARIIKVWSNFNAKFALCQLVVILCGA
jgi:hypothetical protein